ncbi:YaaC family protein [Segnochrobactraceae bacterium EtOH-i3]
MPAPELKISNKIVKFRKAITTPEFTSKHIITNDHFSFVDLWMKRNCADALPFWTQAKNYYYASKNLPTESAPLTSYYCMLNAAKALLTAKGVEFSPYHGVTGDCDDSSRINTSNEYIKFKGGGVIVSLSQYLGDEEENINHNLNDLLGNLPYIHRSYCFTNKIKSELFIPIHDPKYRIHPNKDINKVWWSANVDKMYCDGRILKYLQPKYNFHTTESGECEITTKKRIKWHSPSCQDEDIKFSHQKLNEFHKTLRIDISVISGFQDSWYLKRCVTRFINIKRHGLVISMLIMHRLSEISRYNPDRMLKYLNGKENWLINEFVRASIVQFIDEISCEITSLELKRPKAAS